MKTAGEHGCLSDDRRAYAIIIGAMRSGTSSLFGYLSQHPAICPCRVKEPEYFSEYQRHRVVAQSYEELWKFDGRRHRVCLEASTGYTKYPHETGVPRRMAEYGLEPKFIYLLRDPIDRIVSQRDFEHFRFRTTYDRLTDDHLVTPSLYYRQLEQFLHHFPDRDRYLILDFDDLALAPSGVVRRCVEFLGLDPHQSNLTRLKVNRTPYPGMFEAWFRSSRLGIVTAKFAPKLARRLRRLLRTFSPPARPQVNEDDRRELHQLLSADMMRLQAEFGVDINRWGF